jgi:peptide chain release factor 1
MFDKLLNVENKYDELMTKLGTAELQSDAAEYRRSAKTLSELEPLVQKFREYKAVDQDIKGAQELVNGNDAEMRELAREELKTLETRRDGLLQELKILLIPKDPNDEKNVILEIRAGTGGDEAALFAGDLFRMYSRYAERQGWRIEVMSTSESGTGGVKEVIASIEGRGVYSRLKYESGVHRVQRVPATEASGRIHTSTATVAVLPEAEEVDIQINERICASTRSARAALAARASTPRIGCAPDAPPDGARRVAAGREIADQESREGDEGAARAALKWRCASAQEAMAKERRGQVGTGERSEKIRTYNFPQSRITDHRINFTTHRLHDVLEGDPGEFIDQLTTFYNAEKLKEATTV